MPLPWGKLPGPPYKRPSLSSLRKVETGESRRSGVLRLFCAYRWQMFPMIYRIIDFRQLNEHNVAESLLRVAGNSDGADARLSVDDDPLVLRCEESVDTQRRSKRRHRKMSVERRLKIWSHTVITENSTYCIFRDKCKLPKISTAVSVKRR